MKTIKVSDGLAIKIDQDEWRLIIDRSDGLTLFSAAAGQTAWSYRPEFARMRGLPSEGGLPVDMVEEVVLGWSSDDSAWHLGLLLAPELAAERGGRWCQVARWSTMTAPVERGVVEEAGRTLADILGKRLRIVGPRLAPGPAVKGALLEAPETGMYSQAAPSTSAPGVSKTPAPIRLPLELGDWRLREIDLGLQLEHEGVWSLKTLWNIVGRGGLAALFIVISALTLRSDYAPVQPDFLPYAGLLLGAILAAATLGYVLRLLRTEVVVIDAEERQVRRHLDLTSDVLASYEFDEIAAVVATQIAQGGRQRGENGAPDKMAHEGWLHLLLEAPRMEIGKARDYKPEDAYIAIGYINLTEGEVVEGHLKEGRKVRELLPLSRAEATTNVLRAAALIAEVVGVQAYIDQR
ncbi:MAG: hypothetical protein JXN59_06625 [Anaerolineae bacterium]|nr:hypothetical protein [Anaerolineae bacterium]